MQPARPPVTGPTPQVNPGSAGVAGVTENALMRAGNHSAECESDVHSGLFSKAQEQRFPRKKCIVTRTAVSRSASSGVPVRTAAQRILRSLNSLSVVVADSVPAVRDLERTHRPEALDRLR